MSLTQWLRQRYDPILQAFNFIKTNAQQDELMKYRQTLPGDVQFFRTGIAQVIPLSLFSTFIAFVKTSNEADVRISAISYTPLYDCTMTTAASVCVISTPPGDYEYQSLDVGTTRVRCKQTKIPQEVRDIALAYPVNLILEDLPLGTLAMIKTQMVYSNTDMAFSTARFEEGLRKLVSAWRRDVASSYGPKGLEKTTST